MTKRFNPKKRNHFSCLFFSILTIIKISVNYNDDDPSIMIINEFKDILIGE